MTVWHHPKGLLERECIPCHRGPVNVTAFNEGTAVPPGLASPVSLHCWSAQLREANLVGTLKLLQCFIHCWTFGTHAQGWERSCAPMTSSFEFPSLFALLEPNQDLRPHFISIRQRQDNTYLNFIYSLNRQDRQRVAVETKALER